MIVYYALKSSLQIVLIIVFRTKDADTYQADIRQSLQKVRSENLQTINASLCLQIALWSIHINAYNFTLSFQKYETNKQNCQSQSLAS